MLSNKENNKCRKLLFILGTRPEAIKLAPLILKIKETSNFKVFVCNTEQQKELSNQTLCFFNIKADFNLNVMKFNQTLPETQARIIEALSTIYEKNDFDATIVQGDTMSVFCGALVSFYNKVPVFHVEAGLRSYDLMEPYPEEAIRQMTSRICTLHFAPTQKAFEFLLKENIQKNKIILSGNTVIDAMSCLPESTMNMAKENLKKKGVVFDDKMVLVTAHRRENHGERINKILSALSNLATEFYDHQFIVPVHPNPNVHDKFYEVLGDLNNVLLTSPLDYPEIVCIMKNTKLILTDSGGIQEEAPSFGNRILVLRYETERPEGIDAGFSMLVGANEDLILSESRKILSREKKDISLDGKNNPYGDGFASKRISLAITEYFEKKRGC